MEDITIASGVITAMCSLHNLSIDFGDETEMDHDDDDDDNSEFVGDSSVTLGCIKWDGIAASLYCNYVW